jgi:Icc-related predicted phosphoesterase
MRLLVLADIDDLHWKGGSGSVDAVLSCGDVDDAVILEAVAAHGHPPVFAVKGNHDRNVPFAPPIRDAHLQVHEVGELTIGGFQGCVRYKPRGHFLYDQDEAEHLLRGMPPVEIFLAHNAPRHVHDGVVPSHLGFEALTRYIQRCSPLVLLHGHQHRNARTWVGQTQVIGVHGHRVIEVE